MKTIDEIKYRYFMRSARRRIAEDGYYSNRLISMSYEIAKWKSRKQNAPNLGGEKAYYKAMEEIYVKRFNYYLRKGA